MCEGCYRELYSKAAKERDELKERNRRLVQQKGELINRIMRMEREEKDRKEANEGYLEVCGKIRWVKEN